MRNWWVLVALLVGLATPAYAKRAACAEPTVAPIARVTGTPDYIGPKPEVRDVRIIGNALSLEGDFGADTMWIRINYRADNQPVELWTTSFRTFICTPDRVPQDTPVQITAVDAAGNESSTSTIFAHEQRRYRCGTGTMAVLFVIPVFAIGFAIVLFIISFSRRRRLAQPGLELSPLQAESMIRETINDLFIYIAVMSALTIGLYLADEFFISAIFGWFPVTRLGRLFLTRRFLRHVDRGTPLFLHSNLLATADRDFVIVPPQVAKHAASHGMPSAQIRGLPSS